MRGKVCLENSPNGLQVSATHSICSAVIQPSSKYCNGCGTNVINGLVAEDVLLPQTLLESTSPIIEEYKIVSPVGVGGFGVVYLAEVTKGQHRRQKAAVKESQYGAKSIDSLPFSTLSALSHPNLVQFWDYFSKDQRQYLIMNFIPGDSLDRLMSLGGLFTQEDAILMASQVMPALSYLHGRQIIHRDLKPGNIVWDISTGKPNYTLVDLGIAKQGSISNKTQTVARGYGSVGYAPPEQYSSGSGQFTDVYGFGATLYHLMSGQVPYASDDRIAALVTHSPDPLIAISNIVRGLSPNMSYSIMKALSLKAGDRYPTIEDFRADLLSPKQFAGVAIGPTISITESPLKGLGIREFKGITSLRLLEIYADDLRIIFSEEMQRLNMVQMKIDGDTNDLITDSSGQTLTLRPANKRESNNTPSSSPNLYFGDIAGGNININGFQQQNRVPNVQVKPQEPTRNPLKVELRVPANSDLDLVRIAASAIFQGDHSGKISLTITSDEKIKAGLLNDVRIRSSSNNQGSLEIEEVTGTLDLISSGASPIVISQIAASSANIELGGQGNITIPVGKIGELNVKNSKSGDINIGAKISKLLSARALGDGDIKLTDVEGNAIKARSTGMGDIYINGDVF